MRIALAHFTGVSPVAVKRWEKKASQIQGSSLIKSRYFLELLGYEITELKELDPTLYKVGQILAYEVASMSDIAQGLGYTSRPRSVLDVLLGRHDMPSERRGKAEQYVKLLKNQLVVKQQELIHVLPLKKVHPAKEKQTIQLVLKQSGTVANGHSEKKLILEAAAYFVSGLIPIADFLLSDSCSEKDRKKLHELAGADSVLRLTTRLRRLCSETARRQLKDI